jgi:hypothetical protein
MHRLYALLAPVIFAAIIYGSYVAYDHVPELIARAEESWGWVEAKVLGAPVAPVVPWYERATHTRPKVDHFTLHKSFAMTESSKFDFQVPPHVAIPKFSGTFHAYIKDAATSKATDQPGDVDFLLLNQDQYVAYQQGGAGDALDSAPKSSAHGSSVILSPTFNDPQTYYIVFRNSSPDPKIVETDFTADFSN